MKVCFVYREFRKGGFSIEEVFRNVRKELPKEIEQLEYYVDSTKSKYWNMRQLSKVDADVFHITGDCNYMALLLPRGKTLLTIHDIGHLELTLKGSKRMVYRLLWWTLPLSKVHLVTTVSDFTKNKVLAFFKKLSSEKVKTVYNPANKKFSYQVKETYNTIPQILQVGGGANKNIESLLRSVDGLDVKLVLVRPKDQHLEAKLDELNIAYEWHSNLSEDELISVYSKVDIVFFASTYEGFGLPIIEAQSVGRPVITSNLCSMPEVMGSSSYIVDPYNTNEIKNAIKQLLIRENWESEVARGLENVKRFDSSKIAMEYYRLYKKFE